MNNGGLKQPLVSARRSGGESVMQERHVDSSSLPETAEDIALVGLQAAIKCTLQLLQCYFPTV